MLLHQGMKKNYLTLTLVMQVEETEGVAQFDDANVGGVILIAKLLLANTPGIIPFF